MAAAGIIPNLRSIMIERQATACEMHESFRFSVAPPKPVIMMLMIDERHGVWYSILDLDSDSDELYIAY
jgi:hypothetical protein